MSESLESLLGDSVNKISIKTHIPIGHIKAIMNEEFKNFSKIQFLGFISILQREYDIDLNNLKEKGLAEIAQHEETKSKHTIFIEPEKPKSKTPIYIASAVAIVVIVGILYSISETSTGKNVQEIDNQVIEEVTNEHILDDKDMQESVVDTDVNDTEETIVEDTKIEPVEDVVEEEKPVIQESKLTIIPKTKVWMGYIDLKTNKHHTRSFKNSFDLDPTKDWLLLFGHGYVSVDLDGVTTKFTTKNRLRLLYKDGELKEITKKEFKKLNRGREW